MNFPSDLIAFAVALVGSLLLTIPIRRLALRYGMVDHPGPRKVHVSPMPLLGGMAIYLGFVLALLFTLRGAPHQQMAGILAGATLLAMVGLLDDGGLLHHQVKLFIGMPVAAAFLLVSGLRAQIFSEFFPGTAGIVLDGCLTIVWVVGITASFSILDHMDGLCAGIAAVAAGFFTLSASLNGQTMVRTLGAATLGAALGFLRWNFNPAKIFMGDGGAMFLGFLMAALGLKIRPEGSHFPDSWLVPVLILGVPIFDTMLISISRARRGLLPFTSPGKDHTAHRLSNLGLGHRGAVLVLYCLAAAFGGLAILVPRISPAAYAVAAVLAIGGLIAVLLLESAPYERQMKIQRSSAADLVTHPHNLAGFAAGPPRMYARFALRKEASNIQMKSFHFRGAVCSLLLLCGIPLAALSSPPRPDLLLQAMQRELQRATSSLAKSDPAPYYLSYAVSDGDATTIAGSGGGILVSTSAHRRTADVMMRVGSSALDNTHSQSRPSGITSGSLPLRDDPDAIARMLWLLTDREYQQASAAFLRVKTNQAVQSAEEDKSPDFSQESAQTYAGAPSPRAARDAKLWEDRIRRVSAGFLKYPDVYSSFVILQDSGSRSYLATSEGAALTQSSATARLVIQAETRADDGMDLLRVETFQAASPDQLPSESELLAKVDKISVDLKALRSAPAAEPYAGPAMLSGRAAAVFFHEVLGHRLEGHRQRDEREGQTFTKKVNQQVLPSFLTVVDDPTMKELNGVKLAGAYDYDDEGVPAARVNAVNNGILKNFLMSRMPITNFDHSNGHGRRQPGLMPTGRQGNLIVTSTKTVKESELRQEFIDEIKRQGKPYGLYFEDIQGGFTLTTRALPQAFQVIPVMVWRVYADGRPDELVRGVDIVGTPLLSLNTIILTGDTLRVFNGVCGAESGQIPVAAAAPAMLFSEIEVQKRAKGTQRPPLLSPPGFENLAPASSNSSAPAPVTKP